MTRIKKLPIQKKISHARETACAPERRPSRLSKNSIAKNGIQIENGDTQDGRTLDEKNVQPHEKRPSYDAGGHISVNTFAAKLGSFRYTVDASKSDWTTESIRDRICKEIADEHAKYLADVCADWDANCSAPDMVRYVDEIVTLRTDN